MVWLAMIGASIMVWEQKNVSVDFIVAKFNPKVQKVLSIILKLVTVVVFILMIIQGWEYVQSGLKSISPATGINKGVIYLAIPVGGALMLFQTISLIILEIKEK
jgi:TRAP-type C4-dicarboxylate transport system permease small subunit